jgi:hypothetical protein
VIIETENRPTRPREGTDRTPLSGAPA